MAHKDKDKVYINIDPNKITQQLKDQEVIVIAPKKKKPKPRLGPQAPKAGRSKAGRPKGGWTA